MGGRVGGFCLTPTSDQKTNFADARWLPGRGHSEALSYWLARAGEAPASPYISNVSAFRQGECVLKVYAKVADRAFDFAMSKQNLKCPEISGLLVDQKMLSSCAASEYRTGSDRVRLQPPEYQLGAHAVAC